MKFEPVSTLLEESGGSTAEKQTAVGVRKIYTEAETEASVQIGEKGGVFLISS